MPNLLENVFTSEAVQGWSPIVKQAWLERKISPDSYLRALPLPGVRLATGPWNAQEERLFEERINEFRQNRWPLLYWGIFSLALPHRTGSQCRHFYRQSHFYSPTEEAISTPLAVTRIFLEHHKSALEEIWTTPPAQQISARVDAWLRGERTPTAISRIKTKSATTAKEQGRKQQRDLQSNSTVGKPPPPSSLSLSLKKKPLGEKQQASGTSEKKNAAKNPLEEKKAQILLGMKRAAETNNGKKSTANTSKVNRGGVKRAIAVESDSEDEFVAGTLKKSSTAGAEAAAAAPSVSKLAKNKSSTTTTTAIATTSASRGNSNVYATVKERAKATGGRRQLRNSVLASSSSFSLSAAHDEFAGDEKLTIIRLDRDRVLPGWAREIKPYTPPPPPLVDPGTAAAANATKGTIIETSNILSFPFSSLHSQTPFIGVIINAPLSDDPITGITPGQLATLPLPDCVASDAIVGVWAQKQFVGQVVQCMSSAWGCKYVENLTWVHLSPGGDVARGEAPFTRASHSTLVMGRRLPSTGGSGSELELRHQRSADVIVEAVRGGGRFPDGVREMLETLLPARRKGKKGERGVVEEEKGGGDLTEDATVLSAPRFLEVAFHGAETGVRPGWVKVVQVEQGCL